MKRTFTKAPIAASESSTKRDSIEADIRKDINILFLDAKKLKDTADISSLPENLNYLSNRIFAIERKIGQLKFMERIK